MKIHLYTIVFLTFLCFGLYGCNPAMREARQVVTQADSLRAEGYMYSDSLSLAQAYERLYTFRYLYPTDFAHACYHYGRLLREKENPVAAMECFILATHSRTRDYHILGRIYSNMGSICHLANEFQLSYDMYEKSAEMYMHNGDTLLYYYDLNNMAFELAEQGKKDETMALLSTIESHCKDRDVLVKSLETKAAAYERIAQYDSAVYYSSLLLSIGYQEPTVMIVLAQSYSYLSKKDSAKFYAEQICNHSSSLSDLNNALYILTNDDDSKDKQSIRDVAARRADTQKLIEIRQGKLSQAVLNLEYDLNRKPNMIWLYAVLFTLMIVVICIYIYIIGKRKKHQLLSQKIEDLKIQNIASIAQKEKQIKERCQYIVASHNIKSDLCWNDFEAMCNIVNQQFYLLASKLLHKQILNETETKLCVLVLLNMSRAEIAQTLPYALSSVGKLKDHTAKLLGTTGKKLREYLINLAIEADYT